MISARRARMGGGFVTYRGGALRVEGVPLERIVRELGTPVYVYSSGCIRHRFASFKKEFSGMDALLCYALKANSNRAICRILSRAGAGADVVSGGELRRALGAGFKPGGIVFSGAGKTGEEIAYAVRAGIFALNVESREELAVAERVARRLRRRARVSLRLNPDVEAGAHAHLSTGRAADKFGLGRAELMRLYLGMRRRRWLLAAGIQSHIGSQIARVEPYARAMKALLGVVSELASHGQSLEFVDVGGGMGVRCGMEPSLSLPGLAAELASSLKPWPGLRLVLEPGRFLTAEAGLLATKVLYRKRTARGHFVIVDAAMNDFLRPALYGAQHPIVPAAARRRPRTRVDVVGPVCESADFLGKGRILPRPESGDILAVLAAGAYGFSMSSQYNSRPRPPEALVRGGAWRVIRERERYEDLVRHER